jgi:hypothetical protein
MNFLKHESPPRSLQPSLAGTLPSLPQILQKFPQIAQRAVLDASYPSVIRWAQLALGEEIDRWLIQVHAADACGECGRLWALHLLEARTVITQWAADREFRFQHDRNM